MVQKFILPFIASIPEKGLRSLFLELENKPGSLISALEVISAAGLNIVGIISNIAMNVEQPFHLIVFIDIDGYTDEEVDNLVKLIEKKKGVRRLLMHRQLPIHTSIAPFYNELGIYESRAMVVTDTEFKGLLESLYEKLGKSAAEAFLYHLGQPMGMSQAQYIKKVFPEMGTTKPLEVIPLTTLGWCHSVEIEQPEKDTLKLKIKGLVECQLIKDKIHEPASQLMRGYLAGYISEIMGGEWEVEEQTCIASGAEACIFIASKKQ